MTLHLYVLPTSQEFGLAHVVGGSDVLGWHARQRLLKQLWLGMQVRGVREITIMDHVCTKSCTCTAVRYMRKTSARKGHPRMYINMPVAVYLGEHIYIYIYMPVAGKGLRIVAKHPPYLRIALLLLKNCNTTPSLIKVTPLISIT